MGVPLGVGVLVFVDSRVSVIVGVGVGSNDAASVGVMVSGEGVSEGKICVRVAVTVTIGVMVATFGTHKVLPATIYSDVRQFASIRIEIETWKSWLILLSVSPDRIVYFIQPGGEMQAVGLTTANDGFMAGVAVHNGGR